MSTSPARRFGARTDDEDTHWVDEKNLELA